MKQRIVPVMAAILLLCTMPVYASQPPESNSGGDTATASIYQIQAEGEAQPEQPPAPATTYEARNTPDQAREIYPVSTHTTEQNGILFLHRVYEVAPDFDPESLAQPFEQDGYLFSRQDILKQELPGTTETRLAYQVVSIESEETDESKIKQQLVPVIDHEENGYTGQLQLDSSSIVMEASGYSYYQYTVTKEKEFTPLDRNDPVYMEKDTDENGVSMKLMDVEWSAQATTQVAGSLVPAAYSGNAIYQGVATGRAATGYTVTAAYIGELTKVTPGNVQYTVIFRGEPVEPEKEPINPVPIAAASFMLSFSFT